MPSGAVRSSWLLVEQASSETGYVLYWQCCMGLRTARKDSRFPSAFCWIARWGRLITAYVNCEQTRKGRKQSLHTCMRYYIAIRPEKQTTPRKYCHDNKCQASVVELLKTHTRNSFNIKNYCGYLQVPRQKWNCEVTTVSVRTVPSRRITYSQGHLQTEDS
jgi:hypothetical protein